jgi:arabinan endo-1,5-alpha-L-arabinosidase
MKKMKHRLSKVAAVVLTFTMMVSGLTAVTPQEVQAATKPTKLTVKTESKTLGTSKTLYVNGPAAYKKTTIKVTVTPAKASKSVRYTSSDKKVIAVSAKGVVTAKKTGTAKVTVQSKKNTKLKKTIKFTVKKYVYPTKLTASAASSTIYNSTGEKHTTTIKSTVTPSTATVRKVTYSSNNKTLATVSASGKVTANTKGKTGTVKITVKSQAKNKKGKYLSKTVAIKVANRPNPSSVALNTTNATRTITGMSSNPTLRLTATVAPSTTNKKTVTWSSSDTTIATVSAKGVVTAKAAGKVTITAKTVNGKTATCTLTVKKNTVSVHDPSIVKGTDGTYYIFGSHMAWAKTKNLISWSTFTNNINTSYSSIYGKVWNTWCGYDANGNRISGLDGNLWAPDVIWNPTMKKWCMYMSNNGPDYNSVITLATADDIAGPYTYVGAVVYSGFTNKSGYAGHNVKYTDYEQVTGESTVASRYLSSGSWNNSYGTNAIDPCVRIEDDGTMWMTYGSWFGGIYAIKLDPKTGLRDYSTTYTLDTNVSDGTASDPYMGIRIAGGGTESGEASYIIKNGGYYYLFLSYGGLEADGGYNIRVFRSTSLTGTYKDKAGNLALNTTGTTWGNNTNGNIGIRLMAGYKWPCNSKAYLAQGHNSALVDSDGKMYLIFHTRNNEKNADGSYVNGHYVKTHQMYMSEDGWLCVAPYEYNGETISAKGYSKSQIVGVYDYLVQNPGQASGTYTTSVKISLGSDGSVRGTNITGTWEMKSNTAYATFTINGVVYKGVFAIGYMEDDAKTKVMTFTAVGDNNVCIWGSKTTVTDSVIVSRAVTELDNTFATPIRTTLPTTGFGDAKITYVSSNKQVIKNDGTVTRPTQDTKVTVTAKIVHGSYTRTKDYTVTVKGITTTAATNSEGVIARYTFDNSGALGEDSSGNGVTATTNSTTYLSSFAGRSGVLHFNGDANSYVKLPATVSQAEAFTFTGWVYGTTDTWWQRIFDLGDGAGESAFLTNCGGTGVLRFDLTSSENSFDMDDTAILPTNQWNHLAVTISEDGATAMYLNGVLVSAYSAGSLSYRLSDFNGTQNYLGKSQYDVDAMFSGYMDNITFYGKALTATEIKADMEK